MNYKKLILLIGSVLSLSACSDSGEKSSNNKIDSNIYSDLHKDNVEPVKEYINSGHIHERDKLLVEAVFNSAPNIINYLLSIGANPLLMKPTDPQISMIHGNYKKTMLILDKSGIDLTSRDKEGRTALYHASEYALSKFHDITPEKSEAVFVMNLLKTKNINIHNKDNEGNTALSVAGDIGVKKLVEWGLDINAQNNKGETALLIACNGFYELDKIKTLISLKADPNIPDYQGTLPLYSTVLKIPEGYTKEEAAGFQDLQYKITKVLLNGGARTDLDKKSVDEMLQHSWRYNQKVYKLLIQNGLKP